MDQVRQANDRRLAQSSRKSILLGNIMRPSSGKDMGKGIFLFSLF